MSELSRAEKFGLQTVAWLNEAAEVWEAISLDNTAEIDADQYEHLEASDIECMRADGLNLWMEENSTETTMRGEWAAHDIPRVVAVVVQFSGGGPGTRVVVDLDRKVAWVEVQDGTPWDDIEQHDAARLTHDGLSMLLEYADYCVSP